MKTQPKTKDRTTTKSTQRKFMEAMQSIADHNNVEFIQNPQWANTGEIRFERKGLFRDLFRFQYNFQNDSSTARFENSNSGFRYSVTYSELDKVVTAITQRVRDNLHNAGVHKIGTI